MQDCAVMECANQKDWQCCKFYAMLARTKISRQCHFANVEFERTNHAPKGLREYRNFFKLQIETGRSYRPVFQCRIIALCTANNF